MKGLGFGLEKWVRLTNMGSSSDWNLIKLASVRFQICLVANLKKMMVIFVTRSVKSHARIVGAMNSVIGSLGHLQCNTKPNTKSLFISFLV